MEDPLASVVRVSILGALPGGEVWSVNPCFFLLNEPTEVTSAESLAIATAVNAIVVPTGLRNVLSGITSFTGIRVEARARDGVLESQAEVTKAAPVNGGGALAHPYQTSWVTSLRSGYPGARGRGRLYWPATGIAMNASTLRADAAALTSALSGVKTYLTAIGAAVAVSAGPADLVVWSRTGNAFHKITSLRSGDILDTQRRRRDALAESYTETSYP
jgi:hypothetical protein